MRGADWGAEPGNILPPELLPDPEEPEEDELELEEAGLEEEFELEDDELELTSKAVAATGNGFLPPELLPDPPELPELEEELEDDAVGSGTDELDPVELNPVELDPAELDEELDILESMSLPPELLPEPEEEVELDEELDDELEFGELELEGALELDESEDETSAVFTVAPLACPSMNPTTAAKASATSPAIT